MILRDYQHEMLEACQNFLLDDEGNGIVAAVGGVGKSLTMNALFKWAVTTYPGTRCMQLCDDAKILNQNMNSMLRYWPQAPIGCYSAGLKQRDTRQPILFCGIQSVAKRPHEFIPPDIILVDEGDMVSPNEETQYQKFLANFPDARIIAFTATPYINSVGCMTNMALWSKIIIDLTKMERFNKFVDDGYLSPLVTKKTCVEIDITDIAMKAGDFDEKSAQAAANHDEIHKAVVSECIRYGHDRKKWLVFSAGVDNGHKIAKMFNAAGIPTIMLSGNDSMDHRQEHEKLYEEGKLRCLVNCGLYGRGWDSPEVDLIAIARPTQSTRWWIQALLRGTRKAEGKTNCLILDFAGNTRRCGQVNNPIIPTPRKKGEGEKGEAPLKICDNCMSYVAIQCRVCPDCGFQFPASSCISKTASTDEIMARGTDPVLEEFRVCGIRYQPKTSKKGNNYLQVSYNVGTDSFKECQFFGSENAWLLKRATNWWLFRGGQEPIPENPESAADRSEELKIPNFVTVDVAKKPYPEVTGVSFEEPKKELFDPEKCTCQQPPFITPCSYCESGDYGSF